MKKSFILTAALAALTLGFAAAAPVSIHAVSALDDLGANAWCHVAGANTIKTTTEGTTFTIGGGWGARYAYNVPVNLDGLEFDFKFSNATPAAEQLGFYFSDGFKKYFSECSTTTITTFAGYSDATQNSVFVKKNHIHEGPDVGPNLNHREPTMESGTGFHAAGGRLVSHSLKGADGNTFYGGFHFKFANHNAEFLKLEISELYPDNLFKDNYNFENGKVTTYLPKKEIAFIDAAKLDTYFNLYAMEANSVHTSIEINKLTDKYIKEAEGFADAMINELTCDATGETAPQVEQWNALKTKYLALSDNAKAYFTKNIGTQVQAALAKYDFIINKYLTGYDDFMNRRSNGSGSQALSMNYQNNIMIIMAVAIVAITGISAFVLISKKRKQKAE